MNMLRDETGQFKQGNQGFWLGKKRSNLSGINNPKWVGKENDYTCKVCTKKFRRKKITSGIPQYCSMKCYGASKLGKNTGIQNPKWKGGVTEEHEKIRKSAVYKNWRKEVYRRDYWTCQICKKHLKRLIAHHIKTFEKYPQLRFELSNGITLCRACHCKIHAENRDTHDFTKILNDYTLNP